VKRRLVWFSAGAASAVAAKLTLAEHDPADVLIVRIDPGSEHPSNARFAADVAAWLGHPVELARSDRYVDTWDVWEQRRYLVGPDGALCTAELKKRVRFGIERPDDVQVFGYTVDETSRADRFRQQNPDIDLCCPLIDAGLTKSDCLALIDRARIELPTMYRLGYANNNCIGCPKGGIGYWNKIRRDFPATFDRMARLERELGHTVLREDARRQPAGADLAIWLDELDPDRGNHADEPDFECSLLCALAESQITGPPAPVPAPDPRGANT
jgi:3'-phosphoadenosine 5'-phosphosulfate sulfotransferase (PAPS reductase)/FAD synthetase